jgi:dTDP-glucose 4,6-dehydratase|tara:strand:- start:492 stop:1484 length:993 start_codon:yes stop_codon:yes gene_type:complete
MKTIFVLGSNSFSGSNFVDIALSEDFKVIGVSRSKEPHETFLKYKTNENYNEGFNFFKLDLNKNLQKIISLIKQYKPEFVVNFSAQGMVAESWKNPLDWYQTNLISQVDFHDQIRKFDFIKKYLNFSTPEVYGSIEGWKKENFIFMPSTPYATSRAACDLHLMSFYKNYDFPVLFTRAANVFGPGQQLYRIIPKAILSAYTGSKMELHGGGYSERSFINISDAARATLKILIEGKIGETYHISTKEKISIRDLVKRIFNILGADFDKIVIDSDERLGKDQSYSLDSEKLRTEFAWKESKSLHEGLLETINWIKRDIKILKKMPQEYLHKS